jgi:hypothetical protein
MHPGVDWECLLTPDSQKDMTNSPFVAAGSRRCGQSPRVRASITLIPVGFACLLAAGALACGKKQEPAKPPPPPEVVVVQALQRDVPVYG